MEDEAPMMMVAEPAQTLRRRSEPCANRCAATPGASERATTAGTGASHRPGYETRWRGWSGGAEAKARGDQGFGAELHGKSHRWMWPTMNVHPLKGKDGTQRQDAAGKLVWRMEYMAGKDPATGERRRVVERFHGTERQARDAWGDRQGQLDREVRGGGLVRPAKQTLAEYLTAWLNDSAAGSLKAKTRADYEQLSRRYLISTLGALPMADLTTRNVEEVLGRLVRPVEEGGFGVSARTAAYAHAVLRRILNDAVRRGDLARNVAALARVPKGEPRHVTGYTLADMLDLMAVAGGHRLEALFAWRGSLDCERASSWGSGGSTATWVPEPSPCGRTSSR